MSGETERVRDLLIDTLAVHRLVRLVQRDTLPPLPEIRHHLLTAHKDATWLELLDCPWCLSVHVAVAAGAARAAAPRWWGWLARALAISTAAALLAEHEG